LDKIMVSKKMSLLPRLARFWTPKLLPPNRDEILEWVDEFGCRFTRRNDVS
jgi:hypothetical protein